MLLPVDPIHMPTRVFDKICFSISPVTKYATKKNPQKAPQCTPRSLGDELNYVAHEMFVFKEVDGSEIY